MLCMAFQLKKRINQQVYTCILGMVVSEGNTNMQTGFQHFGSLFYDVRK